MSLYPIGSAVYASCNVVTHATCDHPDFHHAEPGDKLHVIDYIQGAEYPYKVSAYETGIYPFFVSGKELMSQKPFAHNQNR